MSVNLLLMRKRRCSGVSGPLAVHDGGGHLLRCSDYVASPFLRVSPVQMRHIFIFEQQPHNIVLTSHGRVSRVSMRHVASPLLGVPLPCLP